MNYLLRKDDNLYERYEAENKQSAGNIAPKAVINFLRIL